MRTLKKTLLSLAAGLFCLAAYAQNENVAGESAFIDEGDATVITLQNIIETQQDLNLRANHSSHVQAVWSRPGSFNFCYSIPSTLEIVDPTPADAAVKGKKYKSKYGFAVQSGRNYRLHKKPIADMVGINIDFMPLDLSADFYEADKGDVLYDSGDRYISGGNEIYRRAWGLGKWDFNFRMAAGPSLSISPLTRLNRASGVGYLMINAFFHVGYGINALLFVNDKSKDANKDDYKHSTEMGSAIPLDFGYGVNTSYGVSLSWKGIGLGYEHVSSTLKFLSVSSQIFGDDKYGMSTSQNRIYLSLRF